MYLKKKEEEAAATSGLHSFVNSAKLDIYSCPEEPTQNNDRHQDRAGRPGVRWGDREVSIHAERNGADFPQCRRRVRERPEGLGWSGIPRE